MTWARFDDAYPHHPKVIAAGTDGMALDQSAICYASRYSTDGKIAASALPAVCPVIRSPRRVAEKLVRVGRWHEAEHDCPDCPQGVDGWVIHDFLDFNQSAEEAAARSEKRAEAGRKGGKRSRPAGSNSEASASSKPEASASEAVEAKEKHSRARAHPVPSRPPTESSNEDSGDGADAPPVTNGSRRFAERWRDYVTDNLGLTLPPAERLSERFRAVFEVVLDETDENELHRATLGFVSDYIELACGNERKIAKGERDFLASVAKEWPPLSVFDAAVEAVTHGAGTGEWAEDPKAVVKYMRQVLGATRKGAA